EGGDQALRWISPRRGLGSCRGRLRCSSTRSRVRVKRLGRNIRLVGPDECADLRIGSEPAEVAHVAERLENTAEVLEVGKVDVPSDPVFEPDADSETVERCSLDEK